MNRDLLFFRCMVGLFVILVLYGAGMMIAIFEEVDVSLTRTLITGFSAMFSATVGLGAGYLLGRRNGQA